MQDVSPVKRTLQYVSTADIDYRDLAPASHELTAIYARMMNTGLPANALALAMLGATVNFYDCFDMSGELPELLRALADRLEFDGAAC
jgi:hypothetical protein